MGGNASYTPRLPKLAYVICIIWLKVSFDVKSKFCVKKRLDLSNPILWSAFVKKDQIKIWKHLQFHEMATLNVLKCFFLTSPFAHLWVVLTPCHIMTNYHFQEGSLLEIISHFRVLYFSRLGYLINKNWSGWSVFSDLLVFWNCNLISYGAN